MPFADVDGLRLRYEEAGSGPPILCVPGWTCTADHFEAQLADLSDRHRVVAVDLRGHGQSDAPAGEYTVAALADDLPGFCAAVGIEHPIVLGHAAGGAVAVELAARHPGLVRALVLLEAPLFVPEAMAGAMAPVLDSLDGPGFRDVHRQLFSRLFPPSDDGAAKDRIVASVDACPQHVLAPFLRSISGWDTAPAAVRLGLPILCIRSERTTPPDLDRFQDACPQAATAETVGAGHFLQLFAADQVNAMVRRFLDTSVPTS